MGENVSVKELIAKARAQVENPETAEIPVVVADEIVTLVFTKLLGSEWVSLTRTHPGREGSKLDANLGYDVDATAGDYPPARITVNGEAVTAEEWAELYGLLDAPHRSAIATGLWGLNHYGPQKRAVELGKARSKAASGKKPN